MMGCGASPTPFVLKHPSVSKATAHVPFAPLNKAGGKKCQKTLKGLQHGFCSTRRRMAGQTGQRDSESYAFVGGLLWTPEEVLFRKI